MANPEKFRGARHLGRLLQRFVQDINRTYAADFLATLNVYIHDPPSYGLPSWLPIAQDTNLLHTNLDSLRLNASCIFASQVLYPPNSDDIPPNGLSFTGLEWADSFDETVGELSDYQEGLGLGLNDNNQACAIRREPDWDNALERLIARGQRTDDIQEGVFSRTLWKVVSMLEVGHLLGCLATDCSSGGFVKDGYVLRSELICILALVLRQLINRVGCGQNDVYAIPLATTVITFTHENARVLQTYIALPESGPPELHIVVRLNMAINKADGRDDEALKNWSTVLSWTRFGPNTSGQENANPAAPRVYERVEKEKDSSMRPGADDSASETISERLFSGSMVTEDKDDRSSSSSSASSSLGL